MVRVYLDSSALLKLVHTETETAALRRYLDRHRTDQHVTSALARTEVVRAAISAGPGAVTVARSVLTACFTSMSTDLFSMRQVCCTRSQCSARSMPSTSRVL